MYTAACKGLFCILGSDQVPYRLPVLPTRLPVPHQDVAPKHLWGQVSFSYTKLNLTPCRACVHSYYSISFLKNCPAVVTWWNEVILSISEWRCVHFYIAPSSGRPAEWRAAFREMESHPERPVSTLLHYLSAQMSLLLVTSLFCLPVNHFTWLTPLSHDICLQWCPFTNDQKLSGYSASHV